MTLLARFNSKLLENLREKIKVICFRSFKRKIKSYLHRIINYQKILFHLIFL